MSEKDGGKRPFLGGTAGTEAIRAAKDISILRDRKRKMDSNDLPMMEKRLAL